MKRLSALIMTAVLLSSVTLITGCENKIKNEEHAQTKSSLEMTKQELEQLRDNSSKLDSYIANMKKEITDLKIENQKLIAESKRLEAHIIDLKLELGEIPNADSSQDTDSKSGDDTSGDNGSADNEGSGV